MKFKKQKIKAVLLGFNAFLLFIIAFQIGGKLASAQVKYFDEPTTTNTQAKVIAQNNITTTSDSPYTQQFPEFKDQLSATIVPENPGPEQTVKINVAVFSYDINSAEVTWKVNGKVQQKSLGGKSFAFKTEKAGQTTTIEVTIDPRDRPVIVKEFKFTPGEVDLLWQAEVYAPPFYKGKKLYTPESNLTFVAMPRSTSGVIRPNETVFNWRINGSKQADKSGFGKNTYDFTGPIILRDVVAEIETYTPTPGAGDTKTVATADITVEPKSSGLRLYENSPLQGVLFNRALRGSMTIEKSEMGIAAYPYFQTIFNKNLGPEYTWRVDSGGVDMPSNQNTITLRRRNTSSGESIVRVESLIPTKILQTVSTALTLTFDRRIQNIDESSGQGFGQ